MMPWLMAIFCLVTAGCSNITDQQISESKSDLVASFKQSRKFNEDDSYALGYEVEEEPFKRQASVVQSIPRVNRTLTMRKPTKSVTTSTEVSSSSSSVVQAIPNSRKLMTTTSSTKANTATDSPRAIIGHSNKAASKIRPRFLTNRAQRPVTIEDEIVEDSQITRPSTEEKVATYRRILFSKRPIDHNLRPITEEFEVKKEEAKITVDTAEQRELYDETTKSKIVSGNVNDENADVYDSSSLSTTRPLFTTSSSRLIHSLSNPRTYRPKAIYMNQNDYAAARINGNRDYESGRVYEEESKLMQGESKQPEQIAIRDRQRISSDSREYVRQEQTDEPASHNQQSLPYVPKMFSMGLLVEQDDIEEDGHYSTGIPIDSILYQPRSSQHLIPSTNSEVKVRYITDSPISESEEKSRGQIVRNDGRSRTFHQPPVFVDHVAPSQPTLLKQAPRIITPQHHERDYPPTGINADYSHNLDLIGLTPEPPNLIALPLRRRDFQILLKRLLGSRSGIAKPPPYSRLHLMDTLYQQEPWNMHQPPLYQTPVPRANYAYDSLSLPIRYGERVPMTKLRAATNAYSTEPNTPYQSQPYDSYEINRYSRRVNRPRFNSQEASDRGNEILPSYIREALLLSMLELAISVDRSAINTITPPPATSAPVYRKSGPTRSVQIIEDNENENDTIKKKLNHYERL